jgi:hypothetical protein
VLGVGLPHYIAELVVLEEGIAGVIELEGLEDQFAVVQDMVGGRSGLMVGGIVVVVVTGPGHRQRAVFGLDNIRLEHP